MKSKDLIKEAFPDAHVHIEDLRGAMVITMPASQKQRPLKAKIVCNSIKWFTRR